jgi:hypothetical protein
MPKYQLSTLFDGNGVASKYSKATNRELNLFSSSSGNETTDFFSITDPTSLVGASAVATPKPSAKSSSAPPTPTLEWNQLKNLGLCVGIEGNSVDEKNVGIEGTSEILEDSTSTQHHRALNMVTQRRWKERSEDEGRVIVPYTIDSTFGGSDRSTIENALEDLEKRTGSLRFVRRNNEMHYIRVQRRSDLCSSVVGQWGNVQNLNLGTTCMKKGTIQHEFMHALGLHHEHTRPDREEYVAILWDNIVRDLRARINFEIEAGSDTLGSPYDYSSAMHYPEWAFALPNTRTIVPRGGNTIRYQRDGATDLDIKKLKLMYQCERGIVRNWRDLVNNPCTSDCKCREGERGCGSDNNACHGKLVCIADKCATAAPPTPAPSPPTDLSGPYEIGQSLPGGAENDYRCIDLKHGNTVNGNDVWYYPCNQTPAQLWYWDDSNHYIRSSIDKNKCLVGAGGSSAWGTKLIINDCFDNDDQFRWDWYSSDDSLRPKNNKEVCIEARDGISNDLILDSCHDEWKSFKWWKMGRRGLLSKPKDRENDVDMHDLRSSTKSNLFPELERRIFESEMQGTDDFSSANECDDSPVGWYDFFGRNCEWYGELESNCAVYGHQYSNFGRTALSACCVCGGGQSSLEEEILPQVDQEVAQAHSQTCWDQPNWYDSTGDGCAWYEEEHNCEYYGDQFLSIDGLAANDACCTCGGGLSSAPALPPADDVPGCSDSPYDWFDEYGNRCDWYSLDEDYCIKYGDFEGADGKTPNEACCACGGGFNPNATPPKEKEEDGGKKLNGAKIILEQCNPSLMSQQWAQDSLGRLVNQYSGKCLEAGDTGDLYARAFIWTCDDSEHQQWHALSDGRYRNRKYSDGYLGVSECGESDVDRYVETRSLEDSGSCKCAQIWNTDCTIAPPPVPTPLPTTPKPTSPPTPVPMLLPTYRPSLAPSNGAPTALPSVAPTMLAQTSPSLDVPISSPSSPPTDAPTPNLTVMPSSPQLLSTTPTPSQTKSSLPTVAQK